MEAIKGDSFSRERKPSRGKDGILFGSTDLRQHDPLLLENEPEDSILSPKGTYSLPVASSVVYEEGGEQVRDQVN